MDTKFKYLLGSVVFLVCAGSAFWITKTLNNNESGDNFNDKVVPSGTDVKAVSARQDTFRQIEKDQRGEGISDNTSPVTDTAVIQLMTDVKKMGDSYSLRVTCINAPENIILKYEIPVLHQRNSDGFFTRVPGCKSGSYKVNVVNGDNGEILASKLVSGFKLIENKIANMMTAYEFQTLLLNQNDNSLLGGKHPQIAKNIRLSFEGLREGDKRPGDILAVREKIAFGIWNSAKVMGVSYDEDGKIYAARIQPIY